jgi:hypothetical protein
MDPYGFYKKYFATTRNNKKKPCILKSWLAINGKGK